MNTFKNDIELILSDNKSGSTTVLNNTVEAVKDYLLRNERIDKALIGNMLNKLLGRHSNFAVLFHFVNSINSELLKDKNDNLLEFIENYSRKWATSLDSACRNLLEDVDLRNKNVLLHSNSSAIHKLFALLSEKEIPVTVYQTFSSPAGEGKVQAEFIASLGFRVIFIHEDAVGKFIRDIDLAIFGADLITKKGFLNKTGTFPLSLMFNHYKKPVYVPADSRKVIDIDKLPENISEALMKEKEKSTVELWANPPANINPVNFYFEMTPLMLVRRFYFEEGFKSASFL